MAYISTFDSWKPTAVLELSKLDAVIEKTASKVNSKITGMIQASCAIVNTPYEGACQPLGFLHWQSIIEILQLKDVWIRHSIKPETLERIQHALQALIDFEAIITGPSKGSENEIMSAIWEKMEAVWKESDTCYFPAGWCGMFSGHYMTLKIRHVDNGHLALSFLNKGGGAEYHIPVALEGSKVKSDYQSVEVLVTKEAFKGRLGEIFLLKQINLNTQAPSHPTPQHKSKDAYGLLALLGEFLPPQELESTRRAGTTQRGGTCPETNTRLVIRDVLLMEDYTDAQYKKCLYAAKFLDLARELRFFQQDPNSFDSDRKKILVVGAEELHTRILKFQGLHCELTASTTNDEELFLSIEELNHSLSLVFQIFDAIGVKRPEGNLVPRPKSTTLPLEKPVQEVLQTQLTLLSDTTAPLPENKIVHLEKIPENATATQIAELMQRNGELLKTCEETPTLFAEIFHLSRALPLTTGEIIDPFWDELEQGPAMLLIEDLALLVGAATNKDKFFSGYRAAQIEIYARAYDLAVQLTTKLKKVLKLEGFYFPYSDPSFSGVNFYDPLTVKTMQKIADNFQRRENGSKPLFKQAFYFETIDEGLQQGIVQYVLQFVSAQERKSIANTFFIGNSVTQQRTGKGDDLLAACMLLDESDVSIIPLLRSFTTLFALATSAAQEKKIDYKLYRHWDSMISRANWVECLYTKERKNLAVTVRWDPREFKFMEEGSYADDHAFKGPISFDAQENALFLPGVQLKKHQWITKHSSPVSALTDNTFEELLRLRHTPDIQLIRACRWAEEHIGFLAENEVRKSVEALIFEFSRASHSFESNGELTRVAILSFLNKGLEFYQQSHAKPEIYSWMAIVASALAHYQPHESFQTLLQEINPYLKTLLQDPKNREMAASTLAFQFSGSELPLSQENLKALFKYFLLIHVNPKDGPIGVALRGLFERCQNHLQQALKQLSQEMLTQWCNEALSPHVSPKDQPEKWCATGGYLLGGPYAIGIETIQLYKDEQIVFCFEDFWQMVSLSSKEYAKLFNGWDSFPATRQGDVFFHTGGTFALKIKESLGKRSIGEVFLYHANEWWSRSNGSTATWQKSGYANSPTLGPTSVPWANGRGEILVTDEKGNPLYQQKENLIHVLNEEGKILLPLSGEWKNYLEQSEDPAYLLLKGFLDQNQNGILESIAMPRLGLNWEMRGNVLYSKEFPQFIWQIGAAPFLNGLPHAIHLKHESNSLEKVIIPAWYFESGYRESTFFKDQPHVKQGLYGNYVSSWVNTSEFSSYFVYNIDYDKQRLISDRVEGNLYLAIVYRGQKDYERALAALKAAFSQQRLSLFSSKILNNALHAKDFSPDGCAFDCHLIDFFLTHYALQSQSEKIEAIDKNRSAQMREIYSTYRRAQSGWRKNVCSTRDCLLLSPSQIKRLEKIAPSSKNHPYTPFLAPFEQIATAQSGNVEGGQGSEQGVLVRQGFTRAKFLPVQEIDLLISDLKNPAAGVSRCALMHLYAIRRSGASWRMDLPNFTSALMGVYMDQTGTFDPKVILNGENEEVPITIDKTRWFNHETPKLKKLPINNLSKVPPRLREGQECVFILDPSQEVRKKQSACLSLGHLDQFLSYFETDHRQVAKHDKLPLKEVWEDPLEQSCYNALKSGHADNLNKKRPWYTLKADVHKFKEDLEARYNQITDLIHDLERQLLYSLQATNSFLTTEESALLHLGWQSGKISRPTLDDLQELILSRDPKPLIKKNPCICTESLSVLVLSYLEYLSLKTERSQIGEVLKELSYGVDLFTAHKIGTLLHQRRGYSVYEKPQWLIFESLKSLVLRADQIEKVQNLLEAVKGIKGRQFLLEFPAGAGKTKVLLDLLSHEVAALGYLPIITTSSSLYSVLKGDLAKSPYQKYELLEISIDDLLELEQMQRILDFLPRWKEERKGLLMQVESWDALYIARQEALAYNNEPLFEALDGILNFLQKQGFRIGDEAHQTDSPMTETIKSHGACQKIPILEQRLLLNLYRNLETLAKEPLRQERLSELTEMERHELITQLRDKLIGDPLLEEVGEQHLKEYLDSSVKSRPQWLQELYQSNREIANAVILAKALCTTFLPHIFTLRARVDFGDSIHAGDRTVAPKHDKMDLLSKFADHTLTMALTIQQMYQQGCSFEQMQYLLKDLSKKALQEKDESSKETWHQIFGAECYPENTDIQNAEVIAQFVNLHGRNQELMEYYLLHFALAQIEVQKSQFKVSPADRRQGFAMTLLLSATHGSPEVYPIGLEAQHSWYDTSFKAEVIDVLCQEKNSKTLLVEIDPNDLKPFFEQLINEVSPSALLDRGAFLRRIDSKQFVEEFLKIAGEKYTGGLYFDKELKLQLTAGKSVMLKGSDLVEALKKESIEYVQALLITLLTIDKTTGIDLKQPNQGIGALTVGEKQTLTETIQSAMRMRLLLAHEGQTIVWLVLKQLYGSAVAERIELMIKTESAQQKKMVQIRAIQGIRALFKELGSNKIQAAATFKEKREIYKSMESLFLEQVSVEPWVLYECDSNLEKTQKVLRGLALTYYHAMGYKDSKFLEIKKTSQWKLLKELVGQTAAIITQMEIGDQAALDKQMVQHKEQTQEKTLEIDQAMTKMVSGAALGTQPNGEGKFLPFTHYVPLGAQYPPLLFDKKYFDISSTGLQGYKPVSLVAALAEPEGEGYRFCALSAAHYNQLVSENYPCMIFDEWGIPVKKQDQDERWMTEKFQQDLQDVMLLVALLRGDGSKILEKIEMLKRYGWKRGDFQSMREIWFSKLHLSRTPVNILALNKIEAGLEANVEIQEPEAEVRPHAAKVERVLNPAFGVSLNRQGPAELNASKQYSPMCSTDVIVVIIAAEVAILALGIIALLANLQLYNFGELGLLLQGVGVLGSRCWVGGASALFVYTCIVITAERYCE